MHGIFNSWTFVDALLRLERGVALICTCIISLVSLIRKNGALQYIKLKNPNGLDHPSSIREREIERPRYKESERVRYRVSCNLCKELRSVIRSGPLTQRKS